jgi:HEAT repeat protein
LFEIVSVVIKASSGKQIDPLIADLGSANPLTRDGAVARLTIIGERCVPRLISVVSSGTSGRDSRVSALRALEAIGDLRASEPALAALEDGDPAVAVAAVGVAQVFLASSRGVDALDRLTSIALRRDRPRALRLAAIRALRDVGPATIGPLLQALGADPDQAVALAAGLGPDAAADPVYLLREAAEGPLPDQPEGLRLALTEAADDVPPAVLRQLIERVRFREGAEAGAVRAGWTALRAHAHAALAKRGSRIALYDLKETLESAREPLPVEFLGAAAAVGDASCLEPVAAALGRALENGVRVDNWWIQKLTDVFRSVAAREQVTKRSAIGKRITTRWREAASVLWP